MKTGLIAFHLAYAQVLSVPSMEAVVFHMLFVVLQTLTSVIYQDVLGPAKDAAGT